MRAGVAKAARWQAGLEQIASKRTRESALSHCFLNSEGGEGPHKPVKADSVLTGFALVASLLWAVLFASGIVHGALADNSLNRCEVAITYQERSRGMPSNLLRAIAMGESGHWDQARKRGVPWPWTVTSGGSGEYFPTKQAAIAHVAALQAQGVTNIDVGCMQINLRAHPNAFSTMEQAFTPTANVAYAADFLSRLAAREGDWRKAAGFYHSATPHLYARYLRKIDRLWAELGSAPLQPTPVPGPAAAGSVAVARAETGESGSAAAGQITPGYPSGGSSLSVRRNTGHAGGIILPARLRRAGSVAATPVGGVSMAIDVSVGGAPVQRSAFVASLTNRVYATGRPGANPHAMPAAQARAPQAAGLGSAAGALSEGSSGRRLSDYRSSTVRVDPLRGGLPLGG